MCIKHNAAVYLLHLFLNFSVCSKVTAVLEKCSNSLHRQGKKLTITRKDTRYKDAYNKSMKVKMQKIDIIKIILKKLSQSIADQQCTIFCNPTKSFSFKTLMCKKAQ